MRKESEHKRLCFVCNSLKLEEIERLYLEGESIVDIVVEVADQNIQYRNIWNHVKYFELDKKRDNSTLALVDKLRDRIPWKHIKINSLRDVVGILTLRAKLKGEIVDHLKVEDALADLPSEQLRKLGEQAANVIRLRTEQADNQDSGQAQAKG
jgi:hypothetical protein